MEEALAAHLSRSGQVGAALVHVWHGCTLAVRPAVGGACADVVVLTPEITRVVETPVLRSLNA